MIKTIGIVGGGLAGAVVAQTLRTEGYDGRIVLFGDEPYQPYDRPSLSKSALLAPEQTQPQDLFDPDWARVSNVEFHTSDRVNAIDPGLGKIWLQSGLSFDADRIVIATGAKPRRISVPGACLEGVHYLRTWADTASLRDAISPGSALVIIGGGLIGCEVATTATKLGAKVTLIESCNELLERTLGTKIGGFCRQSLQDLGVDVRLDTKLAAIEGTSRVNAVRSVEGQLFPADVVLISIGGLPSAELAADAGLTCGWGVEVDAYGATSSGSVYAAGDVTSWPLMIGGRRCIETYLNSHAQAETVAKTMLGRGVPAPQIPRSWTEIAGHKIQVIGDISGPGKYIVRQKSPDAPAIHFRLDDDGMVLSAVAVGVTSEYSVAARLVEQKIRINSEILTDVGFNLRDLLRNKK